MTTVAAGVSHLEQAAGALGAARDHLLKRQDPVGWWKAELQTNVTMDAEDLLLRHFLGILEPEVARASARWIRSQQQPDGSWNTFHGGPPDLSTTIEAYVALRLAGDEPSSPHLQAAAALVRGRGGIAASRVFTRIWLALFGEVDWESLPVLPAEIMFLPPAAPLNIYDFGCWARQTIVALTVVTAHRPARRLPFTVDELRAPEGPVAPGPAAASPPQPALDRGASHNRPDLRTTPGRFLALDRLLHAYERLPRWFLPRPLLRRAALRRAEQWIVRRQEADGLWGGIQPPVVYSIIALHLQGYPLDHPVLAAALHGLEDFLIHDDKGRRVEACQSPVWDTALAVVALRDAGVDAEHPAIAAAAGWLLREEVTVTGDWAVRRPGLAPGGWAFEFANDNYPDIDDTAEVVARSAPGRHRSRPGRGRRLPAGRSLDRRHAEPRRGMGRLRRRQRQQPRRRSPLLRLRGGHRPSDRGRDRPRHRDARPGAARTNRRAAPEASPGCLTTRSQMAPGGGDGASTTCTGPVRRYRR